MSSALSAIYVTEEFTIYRDSLGNYFIFYSSHFTCHRIDPVWSDKESLQFVIPRYHGTELICIRRSN